MADTPDISVLIATHNRAEGLRTTLSAFREMDSDDIDMQLVIIDNNSHDHTEEVVRSFADCMAVQYLLEPRPGKNCALNHALDRVTLGDLVVFMDDDISPEADCLKAIQAVSDRWPDADVFGGRIDIAWPNATIPKWAANPRIQPFAFGLHDQPGGEGPYRPKIYPFGGIFWVRRSVFEERRRFDELVGPRPTDRIMGSESTFLKRLDDEGYVMVYAPTAVVKHRIQKDLLTVRAVWRRAFRQGRGTAYWRGPAFARVFHANRLLWYPICLGGIVMAALLTCVAMLSVSSAGRIERSVKAIKHLAHAVESLRLSSRSENVWSSCF